MVKIACLLCTQTCTVRAPRTAAVVGLALAAYPAQSWSAAQYTTVRDSRQHPLPESKWAHDRPCTWTAASQGSLPAT